MNSDTLLTAIIKEIDKQKGADITLMDFRNIENTAFKYFVLCTGTSNTHVKAISDIVRKNVSKETKEKPSIVEGEHNAEWILLDYTDIVVHVFQKNIRELYALEKLWGDTTITQISSS